MTVVAGGGEDAQSTSTPHVPHCGEDCSAEWALPFLQMLCSWGSIFRICRETQAFHFWRKLNFCSVSYLKTTMSAEASWKTSTDAITAIYQAWNSSASSDCWIHGVNIPLSADTITWLSREARELVSVSPWQHKNFSAGSGYLLKTIPKEPFVLVSLIPWVHARSDVFCGERLGSFSCDVSWVLPKK